MLPGFSKLPEKSQQLNILFVTLLHMETNSLSNFVIPIVCYHKNCRMSKIAVNLASEKFKEVIVLYQFFWKTCQNGSLSHGQRLIN